MSLTLWDLIEPLLPRRKKSREIVAPGPMVTPVRPRVTVARPALKVTAPATQAARAASSSRNAGSVASAAARELDTHPQGARMGRGNQAAAQKASMQDRYDEVTQAMLTKYSIRVRKWRSGMTGMAWYVTYKDGTISRLIESPRPKGPMSAAVFLHEIGHHAIGFHTFKPRCLEEYHAWRWSLEQMEALGLNVTDQVRLRMHQSLYYAVQKAQRRGIKQIPAELGPFLEKPPRSRAKAK